MTLYTGGRAGVSGPTAGGHHQLIQNTEPKVFSLSLSLQKPCGKHHILCLCSHGDSSGRRVQSNSVCAGDCSASRSSAVGSCSTTASHPVCIPLGLPPTFLESSHILPFVLLPSTTRRFSALLSTSGRTPLGLSLFTVVVVCAPLDTIFNSLFPCKISVESLLLASLPALFR